MWSPPCWPVFSSAAGPLLWLVGNIQWAFVTEVGYLMHAVESELVHSINNYSIPGIHLSKLSRLLLDSMFKSEGPESYKLSPLQIRVSICDD